MQINFRHFRRDTLRSFSGPFCVCIFWLISLLAGTYIATFAPTTSQSLMLTLVHSRMSIVSLTFVAILPFVLSAIILRFFSWPFLIPIVSIKAYCLGFVGSLVFISYPGAGWLMRWLLIFTDSVLVIMQLYLWIQCSVKHPKQRIDLICTYIIWALVFVCLDHYCVYPFALSLLECSF